MTIKTEPFVVNFGPVHPSTHGVYRMRVTLDGEVVMNMEPVFGYLHRGIEKLCEERTYAGIVPLTDRLDYISPMSNNWAYCMAVEKLAGIKVPERAEYLRVILAEMQRIANHLIANGSMLSDAGAYFTPFMYMFREREKIIDLFDMLSGQRLTYNYVRYGGFAQEIPDDFIPAVHKLLKVMPRYINDYERLIKDNEVFQARTRNVGVLTKEKALNCSITGPVLRATGLKYDLRKVDPYSVYDRFEFDVPTGTCGDCFDRWLVRLEEMRQSVKIIEQAVKQMPSSGPIRADVPFLLRAPEGEVYSRIESPKGELGFYLVSDGSIAPYRCHIRPTSLINLTALKDMVVGWKVADLILIFGSIDICLGEVDR